MNSLDVYVARHCFGYEAALELVGQTKQRLPELRVGVIMVDEIKEGERPDVPATPSYFLNGRLLFLGNPDLETLVSRIASFNLKQRAKT